ncbi:MAG: FtsX-like permease family protein [bacterium]|nr:FtsX-like permease family protein [bacterium]
MILKFTKKILTKEWRKLLLPFLSVVLTSVVVVTAYFLVGGARDFLEAKNKEFLGGDAVFESTNPIELYNILDPLVIARVSEQINFSGIVSSTGADVSTTSANIELVDQAFPLYGVYRLQTSPYTYLAPNEAYIDKTIAEALKLAPGDTFSFNNKVFTAKDIILEDPQSLLAGFNFLGKVIFAKEAGIYGEFDLSLFRKEYQTKIILAQDLSKEDRDATRKLAQTLGVRSRFDVSGSGGLSSGLEIVERFLVVAILIVAVLALVNIYASVNYLAKRLRRSFAILAALGLDTRHVYKILFLVTLAVIVLAVGIGFAFGYFATLSVMQYVENSLGIILPIHVQGFEVLLVSLAIIVTSMCATVPILSRMRGIRVKELLTHTNESAGRYSRKALAFDVLVAVLPITFFAMYFLKSVWLGLLVMLSIVCLYGIVMIIYRLGIDWLYETRMRMSFPVRMVVAQKKFDGFFGLITFTSLFVALVSVFSLSLTRTSIEQYLQEDLGRTLPSVYVLDIQNSQKETLAQSFPELTLFPNVRARITQIDETDIQTELTLPEPGIDRELGREFNLTHRNELLSSETIEKGEFEDFGKGEVSVEEEFAKRAGIELGSRVTFLIQGFPVETMVTSLRSVDSRSGFPFFYFVLSPDDIARFPATYFGYASLDADGIDRLAQYLAQSVPNASFVNTSNITEIGLSLVKFLSVIILVVTIPPIVLSVLLIITILATLSTERKRDGARLMALGKTKSFIRNYYILESQSTTIIAAFLGYVISLAIANFLILQYLKIDSVIYVELLSLYVLLAILGGILIASIVMWRSGNKSLREYLNYEDNS